MRQAAHYHTLLVFVPVFFWHSAPLNETYFLRERVNKVGKERERETEREKGREREQLRVRTYYENDLRFLPFYTTTCQKEEIIVYQEAGAL